MDSGNSGSLQSSSGGDDAVDDSISAFLHHHMPPSSSSSHQPSSTLFDPLSNYFDVFSRSTPHPSISHPMGVWSSRAFTCHPISTTAPMLPASQLSATQHTNTPPAAGASFSLPQTNTRTSPPTLTLTDQTTAPRRPSKKRSRASRRAPTTVLTTDTTNFRAMVQEFTGIPAPPFPPTTRLDLFNNTLRPSGHLEPTSRPPPYLLRPFPHKLHPPPSFLSATNLMNISTTCSSSTSSRLLSELGISKGNMQNPFAQSLQQSIVPPNYQEPHSSGFVQTSIPHARSSMGTQEEFNLQHTTTDQLSELHRFVNVSHEDDSGCKMINYCHPGGSSSSSKHNEKGSDQNVISKTAATTTGEGIVDSWICSSD